MNRGTAHPLDRQRYAQLASIMLGACMVHESTRIIVDRPWPGFTRMASHVVSAFLVLLWGLAVGALLNRRRSPHAVTLSWPLSVLSVLALVTHATFVMSMSQQPIWGVTYLVAAVVTGFLIKRSFDRGLFRHGRDIDPRRV